MSSRDGRSDDTSFALTPFEKKQLAETRSYSKKYGNKIADEKKNFADKSALGLWWDAKGIFNCSDADEVTVHMERYRKLFQDIDNFTDEVEKGDPKSYEKLLKIYKELEEKENEARRDVTNNKSSAVCRILREFLDTKFNRNHNLKKVECIVLHQRMKEVKRTCESSNKAVEKMNETMDKLINEKNSEVEALKEARRKEGEEAEKRAEAVRRESDERLQQVLKEAEQRSEASRRESDEKLQQVLKEAEEKADDRIQKMKEENEKLRLEAEKIRQESDEKLRRAVEEANRRSETRVQAMAEQNRACLQEMMKMLEAMGLPINGSTE